MVGWRSMMAAYSGPEHARFLYASGKQFKWKDSLDGLLNLLQDEFDFTKWLLVKQDDKMAVIKGTNLTVNWYKSTKTLQIQGINEQMVKQHLDELIWTSNHNCSQFNTDGKDTSQVEFDSGDTKGDSATILASSSNEGKENSSHYISDSESDPVDTQKLNDSISLGAKSASQPNDVNCQSHGCASLDSNLHQFENYFQSEIDILKERLSIYATSPNFSSSQGGNSVDANLLKEDQDLKRRLSEIETKYENLKAEAKIIINEYKSLDTALRLLNNDFSANHEHTNLHPTLNKGVEANKRPDNSDTFEPSAHNNQQSNKLPSSGSYGSKEDSSDEEPQ